MVGNTEVSSKVCAYIHHVCFICMHTYIGHVCTYVCMHACMHARMYECMFVCMHMHACRHACMDGWMDACRYIYDFMSSYTQARTTHTQVNCQVCLRLQQNPAASAQMRPCQVMLPLNSDQTETETVRGRERARKSEGERERERRTLSPRL